LKVRLTKRLARVVNGVNLSRIDIGDVVDMSSRDANVLLAEGWAVPVGDKEPETRKVMEMPTQPERAEAAERPRRVRRSCGAKTLWPPRESSG
jgi:hypothetical protein